MTNRGTIWLGDTEQGVAQKEGICFRPGDKLVVDLDTDRAVGVYLADYIFAGDYAGDKLIVAYMEEQDGGN